MTEDQPLPARTCGSCACLSIIHKPKIMPPGVTRQQWDSTPDRQAVCRLNPPLVAQTPGGRALMQMPTDENLVCWHWKAAGTLPGDEMPPRILVEMSSGGGGQGI